MRVASIVVVLTALLDESARAQQFVIPSRTPPGVEFSGDPAAVATDFDGDGDTDVVSVLGGSQLLLNDGWGYFVASPGAIPAGGSGLDVAALDADQDGDADLVVVEAHAVRLYLNDGSANFVATAESTIPLPAVWAVQHAVLAFDADGDGDADLVVGNTDRPRLFLNDGNGRFADATTSHTVALPAETWSLAAMDIDGDGDLDVALADVDELRLWRNDGGGHFAREAITGIVRGHGSLSVGDMDGDGDPDLAAFHVTIPPVGAALSWLRNDGSGRLVWSGSLGLPVDYVFANPLAWIDVDDDGDLDLASGRRGGTDRLYVNDGTGGFVDRTAELGFADLLASDYLVDYFDGDGRPDLFVASEPRSVVLRSDGAGHLRDDTLGSLLLAGTPTVGIVTGDVDGDGRLDLLVGNTYGGNALLLGDGSGRFVPGDPARLPAHNGIAAIALADLDRDGDLDLVCARQGPAQLRQPRIQMNDGHGWFNDETTTRLPTLDLIALSLATGDLDGDGDTDLIIGAAAGATRLLINDGAAHFTAAPTTALPDTGIAVTAVGLGDVDGDGDLDLVEGNSSERALLFLNDGTGNFATTPVSSFPTVAMYWLDIHVVDLDRDGDLDVVAAGQANAVFDSRCMINDGLGRFTDETWRIPFQNNNQLSLTTADFDADGDLDIAYWAYETHLAWNDGTGVFHDVTANRLQAGIDHYVIAADVDGDRDSDLVLWGKEIRIAFNHHTNLALDHPPRVGRSFTLRCSSRPGYLGAPQLALPIFGLQRAQRPIPTPFGRLELAGELLALPGVALPAPTGVAGSTVVVPGDPALVGLEALFQALLVDLAGTEAPRITNVTVNRIEG
ncbi:MAG: VCBS repeat-containing protein [Planctomycetes bacterium]|nr:VCBS repeat-containing protein [Planctomycetota bacterium]